MFCLANALFTKFPQKKSINSEKKHLRALHTVIEPAKELPPVETKL